MIEVEEYVRLKEGDIFKVVSLNKTGYGYCGETDNDNRRTYTFGKGGHSEIKNSIIGHSKQIKDLIVIGDYINGIKVIDIFYDKTGMLVIVTADRRKIYNDEILHSIVTKEQFKSMEYRLED